MNYLYHQVPKNIKGKILYPLNALKNLDPELYTEHVKKYEGRMEVTQQTIPTLNCLWNDVLHLSAIHPLDLKESLVDAGGNKEMQKTCYQIDPYELDIEKTIVYLYSGDFGKLSSKDYIQFAPNDIEKYSTITKETKQYYQQEYAKGNKPLMFHMIPHILYKGTLNIEGAAIITV